MFKIKRMTILSPEFKMAYLKLGQQPMKVQTHMKYRQIAIKVEVLIAESTKFNQALIEELTEKNEQGEIVKELNESGVAVGFKWINPEEANLKFKDSSLTELEIDGVHPFFAYELEDAKLNSVDWEALTEVIGDPSNLPETL